MGIQRRLGLPDIGDGEMIRAIALVPGLESLRPRLFAAGIDELPQRDAVSSLKGPGTLTCEIT